MPRRSFLTARNDGAVKIKILFLLLITPFVIFGQSKEEFDYEFSFDTIFISHKEYIDDKSVFVTDTIISQTPFGPVNYLVGTTILENTYSQIEAYFDYGLRFYKVVKNTSTCDEFIYEGIIKITHIEKSDTLLIIKFNYIKGCLQDVLCDFEIIDDEILNMKYIAYGAYGESDNNCNFLTCYIKIGKEYANRDFSNIKYVMLNGDKRTLIKLENLSE